MARLPLGSFQLFQLPCGKPSELEQTLRMLVSILMGTFLEPLSQIVAKDLINTVKMDLWVDKVRLVAGLYPVIEGNRISQDGEAGR